MAKIKHNNFMDTIDEVINNAKEKGVVHLYASGNSLNGRTIEIDQQVMYHFGTTGYLGLEQDMRLKEAAANAIYAYGTQFPLSKTYISHPLYAKLEEKISKMYGQPVIITKNSTLGHLAVIPTVVRDDHAVILDHQVHWSVQTATQTLKTRGIPVDMIRHNNLEMLESKIKEYSTKCQKIWYMADGVYSMFGDFAPVNELMQLAHKYPQLHLYIDDVHGMSWRGQYGNGFFASHFDVLPENVLLFGTLSKTFGASGAVLVCPDKKLYRQIKNFGGPLTFSAQLEPASVAAAIASADIHLSNEIYELQQDLAGKIEYFNHLLQQSSLPLIDHNNSPVFYIGTGMPDTGYNFVKRMMHEGFFVNLGLFPAVPVKNTGVRITIARHNEKEDMEQLVSTMEYHYPKALEETQTTHARVRKLFKLPVVGEVQETAGVQQLSIRYHTSIHQVDNDLWNALMGKQSLFDWEGLRMLENVFSNREAPENNWHFHYILIFDTKDTPVLATFLTTALWKDDMLSPPSVSEHIEQLRKRQPYYLTNWVLSTGSLLTEGKHWYLDQTHPQWQDAVVLLLQKMEALSEQIPSEMLVIRDFLKADDRLNTLLHNRGYIKIKMPDTGKITQLNWTTEEAYLAGLSPRSRRHFRNDIKPYQSELEVVWKNTVTPSELKHILKLYNHVRKNNLGLNTFPYPAQLFEAMNAHAGWEFMLLYHKKGHTTENDEAVGMMCCYKNQNHTYVPVLVGMDYAYTEKYNTYRQLLYQTIKRAGETGFQNVDFGLTAPFEKRKLGAVIYDTHAYVQAKDNFSLEFLTTLQRQ